MNNYQLSIYNKFKIYTVPRFKLSKHPLFFLFFTITIFDFYNPFFAAYFQIIKYIPNYAISSLLCWIFMPKQIRNIPSKFLASYWSISVLIFAIINIPFIEYAKYQSIIEIIAAIFNIVLILPLILGCLVFRNLRYVFVLSHCIITITLCLIWLLIINTGNPIIGGISVNRHFLTPILIYSIPMIFGYIFIVKNKLFQTTLIFGFVLSLVTTVFLGARSAYVIIPLQLFLTLFFLFSRNNFYKFFLYIIPIMLFFLFFNINNFGSSEAIDYVKKRADKTTNFTADGSFWLRLTLAKKSYEIFKKYPLLGVGYSNNSFASFNAGYMNIGDREIIVGKVDAHNTFFNFFATVGILGLLGGFAFILKTFFIFKKIGKKYKKNPETGSFIVSIFGIFLWCFFATLSWDSVVIYFCPIFSIYLIQIIDDFNQIDHINFKK